jgi:diacylglycerol kinase family enzyme
MKFLEIIIIYNPNSTGNSKKNAQDFYRAIKDLKKNYNVKLVATKYAGHAEKIAEQKSAADRFIISSSGDGGYHEVVNGVMKKPPAQRATLGLLPSGNANDHYHHMHRGDTLKRMQNNDVTTMELLKLQTSSLTRYAHSYIGIGITPHIGEKLTETKLNRFNEAWIVLKHLVTFTPVKIRVNGKIKRYQNLLCTNVSKMSKVIKLSKDTHINDGKFELTHQRGTSAFDLITHLLRASTRGLDDKMMQVKEFNFYTTRRLKVQLDGEVFRLNRKQKVTISVEQNAIKTII